MRLGMQFGLGGARARSEERALGLAPFSQHISTGQLKIHGTAFGSWDRQHLPSCVWKANFSSKAA